MSTVKASTSVELVILSNNIALKLALASFQSSLSKAALPWKIQLVEWDDSLQPNQLVQVLNSVHVVWLPSNPSSSIKGGVSHNRLVDAIRSGSMLLQAKWIVIES